MSTITNPFSKIADAYKNGGGTCEAHSKMSKFGAVIKATGELIVGETIEEKTNRAAGTGLAISAGIGISAAADEESYRVSQQEVNYSYDPKIVREQFKKVQKKVKWRNEKAMDYFNSAQKVHKGANTTSATIGAVYLANVGLVLSGKALQEHAKTLCNEETGPTK